MNTYNRVLRWVVVVLAASFCFFHLYTAAFGTFIAQLQRTLHLTFAGVLGFLFYPSVKGRKVSKLDLVLAVGAGFCCGYMVFNYQEMVLRRSFVTPLSIMDLIVGGMIIFLVLELTRRVIGWMLVAVAGLSLIYAFLGPYLPMIIAHRGFSLGELIDYQVFGLNGIYSIPLGISATYIILFIILGTLMEFCGVGRLIMDLGKIIAGGLRGGPAKIAVFSSALFGSISGSAAANVYTTGSLTIPMMKKIGYKSSIAGAVEAAASTGGQIMPPIMGAAAFLMAELVGIPYIQVCKAALIPAILYFTSLYFTLDFEAAKAGIRGLDKKELPSIREIIPRLYLISPLIILVIFLLKGYTPFKSVFMAILVTLGISFLRKETRFTPKTFLEALVASARRTVMIATACGAAGIVIGVITLTGIGLSISSIVISLTGGNILIALILIMFSSILMGMGTPTTVAYIIVATLAVPPMMEFGLPLLPSHLFVFYFGVLSMITPPIAIAAYAAAEIAKTDPMKIGFVAVRIAIIAFIVPFMFIFEPAFLMEGIWWIVILRFFTALIGIVMLSGALSGWFLHPLNWAFRIIYIVVSILIISPGIRANLLGISVALILIFLTVYCSKQ